MAEYRRRVVDGELDELMRGAVAIAIEGPRAVGKTRTGLERAATIYDLADRATRQAVTADPARVLLGPRPILIDEWQVVPEVWYVIRTAVDNPGDDPGQFLLTGSAVPKSRPAHPGTGRILVLRMRPMTLAERGVATTSVSLAGLLGGHRPDLGGTTTATAADYAHAIVSSGLPGLLGRPPRAVRGQLDAYISQVIDRDFEDLGGERIRNPAALRSWLQAYASAVSTTTSLEKIRAAATSGRGEPPSKPTALRYLDVLRRLWLIDPIPGWSPTMSHLHRLTLGPKHQVLDPAFAARLLGADVATLLAGGPPGAHVRPDGTLFGALFESLVALDVRTYAQDAEARVGHFRTKSGEREVDLIVERPDRRIIAIEVKAARTITDDHVKHLRWLRDQLGDNLLDAIVVSTGPDAYRRPDGIGVVPAALLGA